MTPRQIKNRRQETANLIALAIQNANGKGRARCLIALESDAESVLDARGVLKDAGYRVGFSYTADKSKIVLTISWQEQVDALVRAMLHDLRRKVVAQ